MKKKILINIELTSRCFANCAMCPRQEVTDFGSISEETMETVLSQIDPEFVWEVNFSGRGEPTLHQNLPAVLSKLQRTSVKSALVTTGVCVTPAIAEALDSNVDKIRLSVSSFDSESFSRVHTGLNYKTVWENIAFMAKRFPQKIVCHLVGGPPIYDSLPETVAHLRSLGLSELYLFPLWNRAGSQETKQIRAKRLALLEELQIPPSEQEYANGDDEAFKADNVKYCEVNKNYCPVGDSSMAIGYNGDIVGCFQDFGHKTVLGNIHRDNLKEVYERRKMLLGNMAICNGCNTKKEALVCS